MRLASFLLATSLLVAPSLAHAGEAEPSPAPSSSASDVRAAAGFGFFAAPVGAGIALDASLLGRRDFLEGGAVVDLGAGIGMSYASVSAAAGLGLAPSAAWRIDLLGQLGADAYAGYGSGLLSSDPGASAVVPFAGARLGAAHRWRVFEFGFQSSVASDVAHQHASYSYVDNGFLGSGTTQTASHDVGTTRYAAVVTFGAGWDL
jgi:hypothetical protein